ncbi:MAG: hypothetical protein HY348_01520 [Nitrospira defluvii]|nr:hypothetical protein [Nitrospira defluvii]
MKRLVVSRSLLGTGLLVVIWAGVAFAENPLNELPAWSASRIQSPSALPQPPTVNDRGQDIIRQTPTLSGRLQLSEQTLIPYVGAGFGGGFVTERDRALGPSSVFPQQNILGESLGKGMMPNEFQMGIRIPF